jgi:hypothetical protein
MPNLIKCQRGTFFSSFSPFVLFRYILKEEFLEIHSKNTNLVPHSLKIVSGAGYMFRDLMLLEI